MEKDQTSSDGVKEFKCAVGMDQDCPGERGMEAGYGLAGGGGPGVYRYCPRCSAIFDKVPDSKFE